MSGFVELRDHVPQVGRVDAVLLRSERRGAVHRAEATEAVVAQGLSGDRRRHQRLKPEGRHHVTLLQAEHLPVIAALTGHDGVDPAVLRRNLVVAGVNLLALREARFRVGDAVLEGTGHCHPCSRMEEALGPGGYAAMRGHGGITARVVGGGAIRVGDEVRQLG